MTKSEAIEILENEKPHCGKKIVYTEGEKCEAYDLAINALKDSFSNVQSEAFETIQFAMFEADKITRELQKHQETNVDSKKYF